jgi:GT2 family glycosyltransferase
MAQNSPVVSVVILNYNGYKYLGEGLKECIDSVLKTDYPNFEVIFVDNGSTDNSIEYIQKYYFHTKIKIIKNKENFGFSEGFNTGIRVTKGKYIVLLSNDMVVHPNWLNPIVELMESDPQIGLAGFKRLAYGHTNLLDSIGGNLYLCGRVNPIGASEIDTGKYNTNTDKLDFIGGAFTLRRTTLQKVGLLDPEFKIFSEDTDLCYRIRKKGFKTTYVHDAIIWHKGQITLKGIDPKGLYMEYMFNKNRIRFALIHFTLKRVLGTIIIDTIWFITNNSTSKNLLLQAYNWNLKNMSNTLKRRVQIGPSPPFVCHYPVLSFSLSMMQKRFKDILRLSQFETNK